MKTQEDRFDELKQICQEHFDGEMVDDHCDCDCDHYIYEAAMKLTLGDDVFKRLQIGRKQLEIEALDKKRKELIAQKRRELAELESSVGEKPIERGDRDGGCYCPHFCKAHADEWP